MAFLRSFVRTLAFVSSVLFLGLLFLPSLPFKSYRVQSLRLRIFSAWARQILKLVGVNLQIDETIPRATRGPRVIVANHVSYLDIPVIAALGPTLFLAKKEVSRWPLIGWVAGALGMLFVERQKLKHRASAIDEITERLREGYNVTVFPEGTTSTTGPQRGRVPYYAGAFRAARNALVPVEVLYLEYSPQERAAWVGDAPFFGHLWNFLGSKPVSVKVRRQTLPKLVEREHQVQSYFWSRAWLLEGGHGFLEGRSVDYRNPALKHLLYREWPAEDNSILNLRDLDL